MGCLQGSCSAIELRQQNGLPGAQTPGPLISRNFTREGAAVFSRSLPGIRDPLGGGHGGNEKSRGFGGGVFREHRGRRPGRQVPGRKATGGDREAGSRGKNHTGAASHRGDRGKTAEAGAQTECFAGKPGRKSRGLGRLCRGKPSGKSHRGGKNTG